MRTAEQRSKVGKQQVGALLRNFVSGDPDVMRSPGISPGSYQKKQKSTRRGGARELSPEKSGGVITTGSGMQTYAVQVLGAAR
jgi:hypothetical protein